MLLNGKVPHQEFYNTIDDCFSFSGEKYAVLYNTEREIEDDSIAKEVLIEEMSLRRQ